MLTNINLFDPLTDQGEGIYEGAIAILRGQEPQPVWPWKMWVRWLLIVILLLNLVTLLRRLKRWRKQQYKLRRPTGRRGWSSLVAAILLPVLIWAAVPFLVKTPLAQIVQFEPDVVLACLWLTFSGIVASVLDRCQTVVNDPT